MKVKRILAPHQIIDFNHAAYFVKKRLGINIKEHGRLRQQERIRARTLFFMICLEKYDYSYAVIGSYLNKDHATVLHAKKTWFNYLKKDYGKYFDEYFTGKVTLEEIEVKGMDNIKLTELQESVFNKLLELDDTKLSEFNETRLKPYLRLNTKSLI